MRVTTIDYKGSPVRVCNGVVSLLQFGTTIDDHSMHYSWITVPISNLSDGLMKFLKSEGLL
jgi:hypothetical protein